MDAWKEKNDPAWIRGKVFARDHGICALCGVDTVRLHARCPVKYQSRRFPQSHDPRFRVGRHWSGAFDRARHDRALAIYRRHEAQLHSAEQGRRNRMALAGWPLDRKTWWDADHITPVCEGGGQCGLDNYRTLCVPCHRAETAILARRRAEARRATS